MRFFCLTLALFCMSLPPVVMNSNAAENPSKRNIADERLDQYRSVKQLSCLIRRDTESNGETGRILSRVFYQRPDKLHVETISPFKRRILSDGDMFYDMPAGAAKGYAKPVAELDAKRLEQLRKVPGTPSDHLLRLEGIDPETLKPTAEFPLRQGYAVEDQFVVVSVNPEGRLARIEFFRDAGDATPRGVYDYSEFVESNGVFIPTRHEARIEERGMVIQETTYIENLEINGTIAPALFNPDSYIQGIDFTSDYSEVFDL